MGIPEVGLEDVHRMAEGFCPTGDLLPEPALGEQGSAGAAIGGEVHPPDQAGGRSDGGAFRMLVQQGPEQGRAGERAAGHAHIAHAPSADGPGVVRTSHWVGLLIVNCARVRTFHAFLAP